MNRKKETTKKTVAGSTGKAVIGCRVHSGWAAFVVVAGSPRSPVVVDRRRIVNADSTLPGSKQPYHYVEVWPLPKAQAHIDRCARSTKKMTDSALATLLEEIRAKGKGVISCGILTASGRPVPSLADALASHTMLHTAEGEFYRNAVAGSCEGLGIHVARIKEKELFALASKALRSPVAVLHRRLTELGRSLGPPWTQDEKLAALAAWILLTEAAMDTPCPKRK